MRDLCCVTQVVRTLEDTFILHELMTLLYVTNSIEWSTPPHSVEESRTAHRNQSPVAVAACCHELLVRCYVSHDGGNVVE